MSDKEYSNSAWTEYDEAMLKFWTARPAYYGLRLIVAVFSVATIAMMVRAFFYEGDFDSGLVGILISAIVALVSVNMMIGRLQGKRTKLTLTKS